MPAYRACIVDGTEYKSVSLAERELDFPSGALRAALRLEQTNYKGHAIAYRDDIEPILRRWAEPAPEPRKHSLLAAGHRTHSLGHTEDCR